MTTFRGKNNAEAFLQITGKISYAYGDTVAGEYGALFKLINPAASGQVTVTYLDGSIDTDIDALTLSGMNAIVKKVVAGTTPILITDFGLYI